MFFHSFVRDRIRYHITTINYMLIFSKFDFTLSVLYIYFLLRMTVLPYPDVTRELKVDTASFLSLISYSPFPYVILT